MNREIVNPWTWQDELGFVQATRVSEAREVLYCSGQTSVDGDGNPVHEGDMAGQLGQAVDNLETVLTQAGYQLSDIVRLNVYTTDVDAYIEAAEAVAGRLVESGGRFAATLLGISRLAFPALMVEIEATAVK